MKYKTRELEGALLDAAVGKAEGIELVNGCAWDADHALWRGWHPATDWRVAGPIIERERIQILDSTGTNGWWIAAIGGKGISSDGPTPLIAAMRAYVASKLGEEVELP